MSRLLYFIAVVLLVCVGFLFGSINQQPAELNLLLVKAELRVVDIALIFMLLGLFLGFIISLLYKIRRKTKRWFKTQNAS